MIASRIQFDRKARPAFIVACLTLVVCNIGFQGAVKALNIYLKKEPVPLRGTFSTIPTTLGRWKIVGKDRAMDAAMVEALGTDKYLDRLYAIDGSVGAGYLNVHLAYYTGMIDAVPHIPARCLVASGLNMKSLDETMPLHMDQSEWRPDPEFMNLARNVPYMLAPVHDVGDQKLQVRMPVGDLELRVNEFEDPRDPNVRIFGGYFFIANGRATATPDGVRLMAFNPSEKYAYYCKVQFTFAGQDATQGKLVSRVSDILKDFLPELMRRLPDWAEVERRQLGSSSG